ncbi:chymotrypsin BI-like isoform X2 [Pectinophora gossypiella]|uniref:chymotrypsin BI-like isoform X2 n=1 Tax=Pectinophora gossypiella TaxID=13191 RepID=UPI00214E8F92|nr:chymotrypsin BI-like isoform X2 [Pectinophora gossypiella]
MLKNVVYFLLPVVLSARCGDNGCRQIPSSRIMGGDITEEHSRPFQAILGAHSLYDRYENGRRVVNVEDIEVHPGWDATTYANDLALLKLANIVQLTETVNAARLPYLRIADFNYAGLRGTVSGWGIASPSVTFVSPTLRQKFMTVMTDQFCNAEYAGQLPDNIVCGFNNTAGTCKGDNGGPLTIFWNATEETILIGVASFVDVSGCNEERPSVFTRVQRYLPWISEVTGIILD